MVEVLLLLLEQIYIKYKIVKEIYYLTMREKYYSNGHNLTGEILIATAYKKKSKPMDNVQWTLRVTVWGYTIYHELYQHIHDQSELFQHSMLAYMAF